MSRRRANARSKRSSTRTRTEETRQIRPLLESRKHRDSKTVDAIVRVFDHPAAVSIDYALDGTEKRTPFEVTAGTAMSRTN